MLGGAGGFGTVLVRGAGVGTGTDEDHPPHPDSFDGPLDEPQLPQLSPVACEGPPE